LLIRPNEGVGEINLGMSRTEVRALLSEEPRSKTTDTSLGADFFASLGLLVHYSENAQVEAVELGSPAAVELLGRSLLGSPFIEVHDWLRSLDPRLQRDVTGATSFRFGVGLFAPHAAKAPRDPVEGVIVFRPGYYD
jgi:hypothetical protein